MLNTKHDTVDILTKYTHGPFKLTEIKEKKLSPPVQLHILRTAKNMCEKDTWKDESELN